MDIAEDAYELHLETGLPQLDIGKALLMLAKLPCSRTTAIAVVRTAARLGRPVVEFTVELIADVQKKRDAEFINGRSKTVARGIR